MARSSRSSSKSTTTKPASTKKSGKKTVRRIRLDDALDELEIEEDAPPEAPAPPPRGNRLIRAVFRPRLLIALALILTGVFAGPQIVGLLPDPAQREEWQLTLKQIHITDPPHWIPRDFVEQVGRHSGLPESMSLRDPDLVGDIARAFASHPWVLRVVQVRKGWPAGVEVDLEYRTPVAMVQVGDGLYPVDADSVLLPPTDFSVADTRLYPLVLGAESTPQGQAGTVWGDLLVLGAARLSEVLADHWKAFDLAAIHVPRPESSDTPVKDAVYQLETTGGSRIIWGRAPGSGHPGELTAAQKIGRLERYREEYAGFEQPDGPYEIDIRHWQEIARRRLPETTSRRPGGRRR